MLTLAPSPRPFLRIRASGRLSAADYDRFEPQFAKAIRRRKLPIPLLLDMRGFRGWTPGGFVRDLAWDLENRRSFSRIAVIGDQRWHRWITLAGKPLFRAPIKYFGAHAEGEAEAWLGYTGRQ